MKRETGHRPLPDPKSHALNNREEFQDILSDEGYSADQRKDWLKALLTELSAAQSNEPDTDRARLITEIKEIIQLHQSGKPKSEDVL
ncbi:hypothetical protein [Hoeflea sp.]|uniref:hypothetical protein n=1 Tax=Hoeflea sp. TaxID=1940281 RepID=UPI003BB12467